MVKKQNQRRAREKLSHTFGRFPTGRFNAITDVIGVRVGHVTLPGHHTGVTSILPNEGSAFKMRVPAAVFSWNGTGELTGAHQIEEWGLLETPILMTGTRGVPAAMQGVLDFMDLKESVILPVVGECDDSFLSPKSALKPEHAVQALKGAKSGQVVEGSVGGGTGLIAFEFKGGIGTSSRIIRILGRDYKVGVILQSNFGRMKNLVWKGESIGEKLEKKGYASRSTGKEGGSVIVIIATDAPLLPHQLKRIAKRGCIGLSRTGSIAAHQSGDLFLSFSTANAVSRKEKKIEKWNAIPNAELNALFEATADAVEESVWNSLAAAREVKRPGKSVRSFPFDAISEKISR